MFTTILSIFLLLVSLVLFYSVYKLNTYIGTLEEKVQQQIRLTQNLQQSLKEIIAEDFLQNDGRLKKFNIQTERNLIYNGVRSEEMTSEL